MNTGIYIILNKINNKWYVGSSNDIEKRWNRHKNNLLFNKHSNPHLQAAWTKYGAGAFEFHIVNLISKDQLLIEEQKYLDYAKLHPEMSYNKNFKATGYPTRKGQHNSEEHRKKISEANKGMKLTEEQLKKQKNYYKTHPNNFKGQHHLKESIQKMSLSKMGHKVTEEARKKMSLSHLGKHHTEGTKEKMRLAHLKA